LWLARQGRRKLGIFGRARDRGSSTTGGSTAGCGHGALKLSAADLEEISRLLDTND